MNISHHGRFRAGRGTFLALVTLLLLGTLAPVSAQDEEPDSGEFVLPAANLPAMVLGAEDFPFDDLNQEYGRFNGIDMYAGALAGKTGDSEEATRETLEEIGWIGRYISPLSIDLEADPSLPAVVAASHITEYEDENGASDGLALDPIEVGDTEEVDAPEVGDESRMVETTLEDGPDGRAYVAQNYSFRSGNLIGAVVIFFWLDSEYEPVNPEEMAASAETLLDRMQEVAEGDAPPLYRMVLRAAPDPTLAWNNQYEYTQVVDGEFIDRFNFEPGQVEDFQQVADEAGVLQEYAYAGYFAEFDSDDEVVIDGGFFATVTLFASEDEAAAYGALLVEDVLEDPTGYTSVEELTDELDGYDGIVGFAYEIESDHGNTVSGYSLYASVGEVAVNIDLDSMEGADLEDALQLLEAQIDCATAGPEGFCEPVPVAELVA
jgi:hypothetical protein